MPKDIKKTSLAEGNRKSIIKEYICPYCKKKQNDVYVQQGYHQNSLDGYINFECPSGDCGEILPFDLCCKIGALKDNLPKPSEADKIEHFIE